MKSIKILLANTPWRKGNLYGIRAGSRWPFMTGLEPGQKIPGYLPFPFFLAYTAALLEKNGMEVMLIDALGEGMNDGEFLKKAAAFSADLTVLETSTPSINTDIAWLNRLKKNIPGSLYAFTGPHAGVFAAELMEKNQALDFVLHGEYEYITLGLARALQSDGPLLAVKGISRRENGKAVKNPPMPLHMDLDEMPWPARHFLPMKNYNDTFAGLPSPNVQVWASRGCPFGCIFCNWPISMYGGHSYRVRDYNDVISEIEWLIREYGFKAFYFDDDTFNIGKERIINLSREIKRRGINIPWAVMARADTTDLEVLSAMRESGLYAIKFGVESGDRKILENSGKKLDLDRVVESTAQAKQLGIKVHLTFTFGLPGETKESIENTIAFVKKVNPDSVQFSIVTPFPGTEYFEQLKAKNMITTYDWDKYDGANNAVIRTEALSEKDLERWHNRAIREWNLHMLTTRLMKNPLRSFINGLRKPGYTLVFIKNLLKGILGK